MSQSADSKLNTEYWKLVCEVHFVLGHLSKAYKEWNDEKLGL